MTNDFANSVRWLEKTSDPEAGPEPVGHPAADTGGMLLEEAVSGGRWDLPPLHRMLDQLRDGDTAVVWKLGRLSRSLEDVLHIMERIVATGAGFRSVMESIDTTTPVGRMMMQMMGSFAEFERAEGRVVGWREKLNTAKHRGIAESVISGCKSGAEMARLYNVSQATVSRLVAAARSNQR